MPRERVLRIFRGCADILTVAAAFACVQGLTASGGTAAGSGATGSGVTGAAPGLALFVGYGLLLGGVVVLVYRRLGLYRPSADVLYLRETEASLVGAALAAALFAVPLLWLDAPLPSRGRLAAALGTAVVLLAVQRRALAAWLPSLPSPLGRVRNVLIYGTGHTARLVMKRIVRSPQGMRRVCGFVDDFALDDRTISYRVDQNGSREVRAKVVGRWDDLPALLRERDVDELLVATPNLEPERLERLLETCREHGVEPGLVPQLGEVRGDQLTVEEISALPVLRLASPEPGRGYHAAKRVMDLVIGTVLTVALLPVWAVCVAAVWLDSGRPVFFWQTRVGQGGAPFEMVKIRTLRTDVDTYSPSTSTRDARATRVGRFLRSTGLDESPQLVNVLRGEMSLVGPRPEMPFLVRGYEPIHWRRLEAKPGITGVWQLSPDREGEYIHESIEYDLFYLRHRSVLLDVLILVETGLFAIRALGGFLRDGWRDDARQEAPPLADRHGKAREPVVLLALDQRLRDGVPESWSRGFQTVADLVGRRRVRVLAAEGNMPLFTEVFRRILSGRPVDGTPVGFAPYRNDASLRVRVAEAGRVITDLPHVLELAREHDVPVSWVGDEDAPGLAAVGNGLETETVPELVEELYSGTGDAPTGGSSP